MDYYLEAQTKDLTLKVGLFGSDLVAVVTQFVRWAGENNVGPDDLWYADVFEHGKHYAMLTLLRDGTAAVTLAPSSSKLTPLSIRIPWHYFFRKRKS